MVDFLKNALLNKNYTITNRMLSNHKPLSIEVYGLSKPIGSVFICFYIGNEYSKVIKIDPSDIIDHRQSSKIVKNIILWHLSEIPTDLYDIVVMSRSFGIRQDDFAKPLIVQKKAYKSFKVSAKARKMAADQSEKEETEIKKFYYDKYGLTVINLSNAFIKQSIKLYGMNRYHKQASVKACSEFIITNKMKFDLFMSFIYLRKLIRKTKNWFNNNSSKIIDFYNKYLDNLEKKNIIVLHAKPKVFISETHAKLKLSYKLSVKERYRTKYIIFKFGDKNEKCKRDKRQD